MSPNIENNPLNTGNGAPQGSNPVQATPAPTPVPASQQAQPTPASMPKPATVPPTPPITPANQQINAATIVSDTSKISQFKKYLIAGIAGIIFLTAAYVAYNFFSGSNNEVETENPATETELNNSLSGTDTADTTDSTNSENQAELEKVVNELKDQYKEEDSSNPPGINIVMPETTGDGISTDNTATNTASEDAETSKPAADNATSSTNTEVTPTADTTPPSEDSTTTPSDSEKVAR